MRDHIAELINKIKNASSQSLESITVPHTKMVLAVAELLQKEGWVASITKHAGKAKKSEKTLEIALSYNEDKSPRVIGVERVSKFSQRLYTGYKNIRSVRSGYGLTVITTPKGIMTDMNAKKEKVGGEPLFKIW